EGGEPAEALGEPGDREHGRGWARGGRPPAPGARPVQIQPRAAHGEDDGSGRIGAAVDTDFGNTTSNFPSCTWNTTGNARSFWPRIGLPSPRNFTPYPIIVPPSGRSVSRAAFASAAGPKPPCFWMAGGGTSVG